MATDTAETRGEALGILAGGVTLAQAASALPDTAEGRRWRAATPALVGLHVLAGRLADAEAEPVGRTRALALLAEHRAALKAAFAGGELPGEAAKLLAEVERVLAQPPQIDR